MNERRLVAAGTGRLMQVVVLVAAGLSPIASRVSTSALIGGVILIACLYLADREPPPPPSRLPTIGLAALIVWCGLSGLWAETPASLHALAQLSGLFLAGLLLIAWAGARRLDRLLNGLVIGIEIALGLYAFEWVSGDFLTRAVHGFAWRDILDPGGSGIPVEAYLINGTTVLIMLLWPSLRLLLAAGRRLHAGLLTAGVVLATVVFGNVSGLVALVIGATAWATTTWKGPRVAHAFAVMFAVVVLASPFAVRGALKWFDLQTVAARAHAAGLDNSTIVRMFIWRFTVERITERPLLGWGFDAARRIPGGGDTFTVYRAADEPGPRELVSEYNLPLHPHNQVLQIWLELGLGGALLVAAFGALILWRLDGVGLAVAASMLVFDALSFGAWQSWWIAAAFIAAAATAGAKRQFSTQRA